MAPIDLARQNADKAPIAGEGQSQESNLNNQLDGRETPDRVRRDNNLLVLAVVTTLVSFTLSYITRMYIKDSEIARESLIAIVSILGITLSMRRRVIAAMQSSWQAALLQARVVLIVTGAIQILLIFGPNLESIPKLLVAAGGWLGVFAIMAALTKKRLLIGFAMSLQIILHFISNFSEETPHFSATILTGAVLLLILARSFSSHSMEQK